MVFRQIIVSIKSHDFIQTDELKFAYVELIIYRF